jgi:hypothetical protein
LATAAPGRFGCRIGLVARRCDRTRRFSTALQSVAQTVTAHTGASGDRGNQKKRNESRKHDWPTREPFLNHFHPIIAAADTGAISDDHFGYRADFAVPVSAMNRKPWPGGRSVGRC